MIPQLVQRKKKLRLAGENDPVSSGWRMLPTALFSTREAPSARDRVSAAFGIHILDEYRGKAEIMGWVIEFEWVIDGKIVVPEQNAWTGTGPINSDFKDLMTPARGSSILHAWQVRAQGTVRYRWIDQRTGLGGPERPHAITAALSEPPQELPVRWVPDAA